MTKTIIENKNLWIGVVFILIAGILIGFFLYSLSTPTMTTMKKAFTEKNIDEKRIEFISEKNVIIAEMQEKGMYRCCLEKPCTYCIEKTPGHGEGAACTCAQDILNGKHPCGECIGEILEGHGEVELAPYFAKAIAHKVGNQHLDHLKSIIADMYKISIEEQI